MTKTKGHDAVPAMTRRHFLERFGAVGGSTLVMGAMSSWELLGAQAAPLSVSAQLTRDTLSQPLGPRLLLCHGSTVRHGLTRSKTALHAVMQVLNGSVE